MENTLTFNNQQSWRNWLEQNHQQVNEVWLFIHKKNSSKAGIKYNEAVEEALCFGWIDGKMQSIDEDKFVLRFSPRKARSVWSKLNKEKAESLIAQGKMTDAGVAKIEEAKRNGLWNTAYSDRIREEIPADLEVALAANQAARDNFYNLANNYQNMFIRWLNSAKLENTRQRRIAEIVKRVEQNKKLRYGDI